LFPFKYKKVSGRSVNGWVANRASLNHGSNGRMNNESISFLNINPGLYFSFNV